MYHALFITYSCTALYYMQNYHLGSLSLFTHCAVNTGLNNSVEHSLRVSVIRYDPCAYGVFLARLLKSCSSHWHIVVLVHLVTRQRQSLFSLWNR